MITENEVINPRLVAGIDISAPDAQGVARGAVVVLRYPEFGIVEVKVAEGKITISLCSWSIVFSRKSVDSGCLRKTM